MVWVSFALCQCMGTCIFLGVRISSCVALVLGSTRRIEICGESLPRSRTIVCHIKSSYLALIAWEAPLVAGVPPLLVCAGPSTATNNRRLARNVDFRQAHLAKKSREGFRAAPRSQWRVSNPSHGYHRAIVAEDA